MYMLLIMKHEPKPTLNTMVTKHIVFGQSHVHPDSGMNLRNFTVKVQALTAELVRKAAQKRFGHQYSRIVQRPDSHHFPSGVYETIILDDKENELHCFKGERSHELIKSKEWTYEVSQPDNIYQHYNTPEPKNEEEDERKDEEPAGERTGGTETPAPRSQKQTQGSPSKEGASSETDGDYDYLSG